MTVRKYGNAIQDYFGQLTILPPNPGGNPLTVLQVSGAGAFSVSGSGNVSIAVPASGVALTIAAFSGSNGVQLNGADTALFAVNSTAATNRSILRFQQAGTTISNIGADGTQFLLGDSTNGDTCIVSNGQSVRIGATVSGSTRLLINATTVTVNSPPAGNVALTVNGVSGTHSTQIADSATNKFNAGFLEIPQNSQSANYTTVRADSGKHIYHPSADTTARTWTIDSNANVPFPIGTAITFDNDTGAGVVTLAINSDTLVWLPSGTTGSRSIAANGQATALKVGATRWHLTGVGIT